jgi:leader peptidase (prepilin peptidase)/N-methyltransferase
MMVILWIVAGATLGLLAEPLAVRFLRGRERRTLKYGRWGAAFAGGVALPCLYHADSYRFPLHAVLFFLLLLITLTDLMAMLIPDLALAVFSVPIILLRMWIPLEGGLPASLTGAVAAFGMMAVLAILSKGKIGGGDVKLYGLLGFFFGTGDVMVNLFLACIFALAGTFILLTLKKQQRSESIPFGPYIALSGTVMLLWQG